MIYPITDFGAVPGGRFNCASAIQQAVDVACAAGGGQVLVPAGNWLSGSVLLKSNVELHLEAGACLTSSLAPEDIIPFPVCPGLEALHGWNGGFFLGGRDAENITISGSGIIDGHGDLTFYDGDVDSGYHECPLRCAEFRPRMILFENIRNLRICDVTLRNAAFWTLHMAGCKHVRIHNISILNDDRGANNDGIDPDSCQDVIISDCLISTGDDAIVLKTTGPMTKRYGPCENIVITGCILHSRDSALKIGTESWGAVRDVLFSDNIVKDCSRGVGIWVRDGGTVEDVHIRHITGAVRRYADAYDLPGAPGWWGKGEPIFINATWRGKPGIGFPGTIRNITVGDVFLRCESSMFIAGETVCPIRDILLKDIHLSFVRQGTQPGGFFDEQPSERHIYPHSIPALYARAVDGLQLRYSTVEFHGENEAWDGTLTETEDCCNISALWNS